MWRPSPNHGTLRLLNDDDDDDDDDDVDYDHENHDNAPWFSGPVLFTFSVVSHFGVADFSDLADRHFHTNIYFPHYF